MAWYWSILIKRVCFVGQWYCTIYILFPLVDLNQGTRNRLNPRWQWTSNLFVPGKSVLTHLIIIWYAAVSVETCVISACFHQHNSVFVQFCCILTDWLGVDSLVYTENLPPQAKSGRSCLLLLHSSGKNFITKSIILRIKFGIDSSQYIKCIHSDGV